MRPLRLELRGFTAFRGKAVVEFEGRRLFVITGPTGAGKSSLLDAMTWALYGQVPRVGNATGQLVTHGEKTMAVLFEFEAQGERYRVSRHQPTTSGNRFELLSAAGEWTPLAHHARTVTAQVTQVLGLDYETFIRTIVLPQGEFDQFLRSGNSARQAILTRLLGLDVYRSAGSAARARAGAAEAVRQTLCKQLELLALASPQALAELEQERAVIERRRAELERQREALSALLEAARSAAEAEQAAVLAREGVEAAAKALRAAEQASAESERMLREAKHEVEQIEGERLNLGYDPQRHQRLRELAAAVERRDGARAVLGAACTALADAEAAEQRARALAEQHRREADAASAALTEAATRLGRAAGQAQADAEQRRQEAASAAQAAATALDEAAQHERRAQHLHALALQAEAALGDCADAERAAARAREAHDEAAAALQQALETLRAAEAAAAERQRAMDAARVEDMAAALQRTLQPGEPCPVCGAPIEHIEPHAAPDLDAAAVALDEAERSLAAARAEQQRCAGVAAKLAAAAEHADRALALAIERLKGLDEQFAAAGIERAGIAEAAAEAERDAAAARARVSGEQARAEQAGRAGQALDLLLARVPEGIVLTPRSRGARAADPAQALREALEAYGRSAAAQAAEAEQVREAETRVRVAEATAAQSRSTHADAEQALAREQQRLAALSAGPSAELRTGEAVDAEGVRTALAAMEEQAERSRELEEAARLAGARFAAASARHEGRCAERERAAALFAEREPVARAAERCAGAARDAFTERWSETVTRDRALSTLAPDLPPGTQAITSMLGTLEREAREIAQERGAVEARIERARQDAEEAKRVHGQIAEAERDVRVAQALQQELRADRFIAYVQREAMELLAVDASVRLLQLTNGRYRLVIEDNEFSVVDRMNGDERRSVKTLSGGETFLASLALSLALSERLPELAGMGGAVSLESLFLDEGFGSLDAQSLEVAIEGLEALAGPLGAGGSRRMVGVISHVPQLAERLQDTIEVVKTDDTSYIRS